jgi:hypothetical protein
MRTRHDSMPRPSLGEDHGPRIVARFCAFQTALETRCEDAYEAHDCKASRRLCRDVAKEYANRVRAGGEAAWSRAQEQARARATPTPPPPMPSVTAPPL